MIFSIASAAAAGFSCSSGSQSCPNSVTDVYHDRIEPLLRPESVKLCNQCHLSGIDLSSFVRDTPCDTMACLKDRGLVDLGRPEQSKILNWITRAMPDSELITAEVVESERLGFLQWIEAAAACPGECANAKCGAPTGNNACDVENAPDAPTQAQPDFACSDVAVEQLFFDDVYKYRNRCFPCHFSSQGHADAAAPRWILDDSNCATSSVETLRMVEHLELMNLDDPSQSLLLLKPLAVDMGGVPHGGADKFATKDDSAYRSFSDFITHYAACKK